MRATSRTGGYTIAMALLYLMVLSAIFTSILSLVLTEHRQTENYGEYVQALYSSEAGVEVVLSEMNHNPQADTWKEWGNETNQVVIRTDFPLHADTQPEMFAVTATFSNRTIRSVGRVPSSFLHSPVERTVVATVDLRDGSFVLSSWREE